MFSAREVDQFISPAIYTSYNGYGCYAYICIYKIIFYAYEAALQSRCCYRMVLLVVVNLRSGEF